MESRIAVFPSRYVESWRGGNPDGCELVTPVTLDQFLGPQQGDTYAVGYLVPGDDRLPRICKTKGTALAELEAAGQSPVLAWGIVEVDNSEHAPHASLDAARAALGDAFDALPEELSEAIGFTTR